MKPWNKFIFKRVKLNKTWVKMGTGRKWLISGLQVMLLYHRYTCYEANIDHDIRTYSYDIILIVSADLYGQLLNLERRGDKMLKLWNRQVLHGTFRVTFIMMLYVTRVGSWLQKTFSQVKKLSVSGFLGWLSNGFNNL